MTSALGEQLRAALGVAAVENVARLSGGASRETWAFDAVHEDGSREELVLRRDPPGRPSEPGSMAREARTIGAASAAGLAVPAVLAVAEDASQWGSAGLVMRRIAGETLARRILRDDTYAHARSVLLSQLGHFAAGLHAIPNALDLPEPDPLDVVRELLAGVEDSSAVFELALAHLAANRPPERAPVIVHGDLRLGNVIVGSDGTDGPGGLRAVLDWELVHAGSPAEDLGWLCVRAWRFGAEPAVAGLGTRAELLQAYRGSGGANIDEAELHWWELYGTLRWGAICMWQAQAHLSGALRSVELAAIGRRVSEQEWDLLGMLAPQAVQGALQDPPVPHPYQAEYGRPTAAELLEAVREFLSADAMPALPGELAFRARVAANAVAIVERELAMGDVPSPADGSVDAVARHVLAKLLVANPRYVSR